MSGIGLDLGQLAPETESESTPELKLALEFVVSVVYCHTRVVGTHGGGKHHRAQKGD